LFNIKGESPSKNIKTLAVIIPTIGYNLKAEKEIDQPIIVEKKIKTLFYLQKISIYFYN
jgi:hypothetical protein